MMSLKLWIKHFATCSTQTAVGWVHKPR